MFSYYDNALNAITECLSSKNDQVKIKTAFQVIEKIVDQPIGPDDPHDLIKKKCDKMNIIGEFIDIDINEYDRLMKENNLS